MNAGVQAAREQAAIAAAPLEVPAVPLETPATQFPASLFHLQQGVTGAALPEAPPASSRPVSVLSAEQMCAFHVRNRDVTEACLEEFRNLRGRLMRRAAVLVPPAQTRRSVLLTSPHRGSGKTFTAMNLALMLGVAPGARVLLVDAHARRPSLSKQFGLLGEPGLWEALDGADVLPLTRQTPAMQVFVLGIGAAAMEMEALGTPRMAHLIKRLEGQFDWVVLDAPPLDESSDAEMLADYADLSLLVLQPGECSCRELGAVLGRLDLSRLAGFVFNRPGRHSGR